MSTPATISGLRIEQWTLIAALVALALLLDVTSALWRWDQLLYDTQLRLWQRDASDQVVIVAIDDASLNVIGRWPWPRRIHADLLQRLRQESPRAVAVDILFIEPDQHDPQADSLLAQRIRAAGNVVLPVIMAPASTGGPPIEALPLAILVEAAAALGHVHIELDRDGIARQLYLYAGLGSPYWPHLSLALLQVGQHSIQQPVASATAAAMTVWHRAQPRLIAFAGPPGHFQQISYHRVLRGDFPAGTFRDKYVLVGVTAAGLGDALPTPVSGHRRLMAGVEINANQLDAMLQGISLHPVGALLRWLLTAVLAALPLLLFPYRSARGNLLIAAMLLLVCLLFCVLLARLANVWYAPSAAMLAIMLSYPLWSWRRMEYFMRYLGSHLDRLREEHLHLQQMGLAPSRSSAQLVADAPTSSAALANHADLAGAGMHDGAVTDQHSLQARIELVNNTTRHLHKLRALIDSGLANMADGVVVIDSAGKVILSNTQAAEYLLDDAQENLNGQPLYELLSRSCKPQYWRRQLDAVLARPQALQLSVQTDTGRDLLLQLLPLDDVWPDSSPPRLIMNIADISALKASDRQRSESLNFLSHDLRAPLVSIQALLEQARVQTDDQATLKLLQQLDHYTAGTLRMAEQFVQLARAESAQAFHISRHDLISIADQAADRLWASARQKNIGIDCQHQVASAPVMVDAGLLERALINLLDNAIKHGRAGTNVQLCVGQSAQTVHCDVIDHGPGIPAAERHLLFQRFKTQARSDDLRTRGAGLGLVFVKTVVAQHDGSVEVESEPGQGTRFRISLPAAS